MKYSMNFGRLATKSTPVKGKAFRLAVLGDFSGRANEGQLETGPDLAKRKPLRVDVDNLDAIVKRMNLQLHLPIADDGGTVEVKIGSMDDFHPDQLYNQLPIFSELAGLRRQLKNSSTFESAAAEVRSWQSFKSSAPTAPVAKARGARIPHGTLDDFARLVGRSTAVERPLPTNELIKRIVGPHIVAAPNPDQPAMLAAVDEALSEAMRRVLHHPDFQTMESLWRSVELLTRELETSTELQIVLYDVTAEELAADLSECEALEESGLFKLLVEQPPLDAQQGPLSVVLGNYLFEQTPPHAELLGRIGKIMSAGQAPFIAAVSTDCLKKLKPEEIHPLIVESWNTLHGMPHASYLGLTVPRFMLRWPYGAKTEPIDSFEFEEFTPHSGLKGMLWANGAFLAGLLLGKTFTQSGGFAGMKLGSMMSVGDIPFYYYTDEDGDQVALPSTERLVPESLATHIISQRFMPVLCIRGRPEIRLGSFQSLAGQILAGPWSPVDVNPDAAGAAAGAGSSGDVASVEAFESQAKAEADDDIDKLLASLQSGDGEQPADPAATQSTDTPADAGAGAAQEASGGASTDDLDALMADLAGGDDSQSGDDGEMDPDLAALLADL